MGTGTTASTERHKTAKVCAGLDQLAVKHDISQNSVHIDRVVQQLAVIGRGRFPPAFQFYMFCKISLIVEFLKIRQMLYGNPVDHCLLTLVRIWGNRVKQLHFKTHQSQTVCNFMHVCSDALLAVVCNNNYRYSNNNSYFSFSKNSGIVKNYIDTKYS